MKFIEEYVNCYKKSIAFIDGEDDEAKIDKIAKWKELDNFINPVIINTR